MENHDWDQKLYVNTEIVVGNPLDADDTITKVVLVEPSDPEMNKSIQKLYKDKFPELGSINNDFEIIEQTTRIRSRTPKEHSHRKIIRVSHDGTPQDVWEKLKMIRDETELDKKIAIQHITGMATEKLRKMSEVVFQKTNTKIDIYTTVRNQEKDRERTTYGMIISEGGKTYKEVLSKVKAIVKTNFSVDAVRSIKSTKDGKLLLTIEKNQDALTNIHKALKDDKSELKTKRLGIDRYETLHIRGLEADSTAEDIIQSIRETVGNWEEDNKLSELRPLNNDTLAATITLKSDYAETLIE